MVEVQKGGWAARFGPQCYDTVRMYLDVETLQTVYLESTTVSCRNVAVTWQLPRREERYQRTKIGAFWEIG